MFTIDCRRTGEGATTFTVKNPAIKITRYCESKTGNHWLENVEGKEGSQFSVKDISNSGKHRCFVCIIDTSAVEGYRVLPQTEGGRRCLICV